MLDVIFKHGEGNRSVRSSSGPKFKKNDSSLAPSHFLSKDSIQNLDQIQF